MAFINNDEALDIIRIALDADQDNPLYEIEEIDNIIHDSNDFITGEIGLRVQEVTDLQYVKFMITKSAVQIYKEVTTVNEQGEMDTAVFFYPIYNIPDLAEILNDISPKSQI